MPIPDFIREQPAALDRCLAAARAFISDWTPGPFDGIALVGSGSSFNALQAARPRFVNARRGAVLVHDPQDFAAELPDALHSPTDPFALSLSKGAPQARGGPLVIVLSQSGASVTSIAAAKAAIAAGLPTLLITASLDSPLARCAAPVLPLAVGDEPVGPKTKGFLGSVALLFLLAEALGAPASKPFTGAMLAPLVEPAREAAGLLVPELADSYNIVFAGSRGNFGIALEASLKIAEMSGVPSAAFPTEELLHGRLHGVTPRSMVFVIAEGDAQVAEAQQVRAVMQRRGCRVVVVDRASAVWAKGLSLPEAPWSALGFVLPFQWLAVLLAQALGRTPEAMRHGQLSGELAIKTDARP
jgi:fructoselysine-6-P-deglycase FrlB-like protein